MAFVHRELVGPETLKWSLTHLKTAYFTASWHQKALRSYLDGCSCPMGHLAFTSKL